MKYLIFTFLGVLVGLGLFSFGYYTNRTRNLEVTKVSSKTNIKELQKNIILDDPVEITNPTSTTRIVREPGTIERLPSAMNTDEKIPGAIENAQLRDRDAARNPANLDNSARANPQAINPQPTGLANEIIPPPVEPPVIYEGWANANFLPEDEEGSGPDIQINNLPETK